MCLLGECLYNYNMFRVYLLMSSNIMLCSNKHVAYRKIASQFFIMTVSRFESSAVSQERKEVWWEEVKAMLTSVCIQVEPSSILVAPQEGLDRLTSLLCGGLVTSCGFVVSSAYHTSLYRLLLLLYMYRCRLRLHTSSYRLLLLLYIYRCRLLLLTYINHTVF